MAFQTVSATQKRSKNGGQITAIFEVTKTGNYLKILDSSIDIAAVLRLFGTD